jgi:hypothetical protein
MAYTKFFLSVRREHILPSLGIRILIVKSCTRWHGILKGLSQDGGPGPICLKTSASPSLMTTYRMNLLSARSISLNSTFKHESPVPLNVTSHWFMKKGLNNFMTLSLYSCRMFYRVSSLKQCITLHDSLPGWWLAQWSCVSWSPSGSGSTVPGGC